MLMQSFAWLAGRLRYQLETDQAVLPNALLGLLYPHLEAPLPSMLIGESRCAPRWRQLCAWRHAGTRPLRVCHRHQRSGSTGALSFSYLLCNPAMAAKDYRSQHRRRECVCADASDTRTLSIVRTTISCMGKDPIHALKMPFLRFCINAEHKQAFALYDALSTHLVRIAVRLPNTGALRYLDASKLTWCGFRQDEAMLGR